jgi:hypothetical protein
MQSVGVGLFVDSGFVDEGFSHSLL